MYYLIEITTYNNGTPIGKGVYNYTSQDDALAAFYGKLRGAIVNETYASELCIIINEIGAVQRQEYWQRTSETIEE